MSWARGIGAPPRWTRATSTDRNHKPQCANLPSSTVAKSWGGSPQERFLVSADGGSIRKLTLEEVTRLQGFPAGWFDVRGVTATDRIGLAGNAVPPPVGAAAFEALGLVGVGPRVLELFAGGGGLALGATWAGFDVEALVDYWPPSATILRARFGAERVIFAPVESLDLSTFEGDVLSGGPPCQPFTSGGKRLGEDDPRDRCTALPLMLGAMRPPAFVFEEARQLYGHKGGSYWRKLVGAFNKLGYSVGAVQLNSHDYGLPQIRCRAFVAGFSRDYGFGLGDARAWTTELMHLAEPGAGGVVADILEEDPAEAWADWEYGCRRPLTRRQWCPTKVIGVYG